MEGEPPAYDPVMLATDGSTVPELEDLLLLTLWSLPITAGLCAVFCASFVASTRRLRAAGQEQAATAKARDAVATALLTVFLTACWGAASLAIR
jgi:hypothetical protein